jgi:glycosyltransferase involved in cell wall biosynthesis
MKRSPKVVHLSDTPSGGAAVAANRLARALSGEKELEVERWFFGKSQVDGLNTRQVALEKNRSKSLFERVVRVFSPAAARSLQRRRQGNALLAAITASQPDILHLHNLHACALRHEDLEMIPSNVRLIWTMHDCWPFAPWAYRWQAENGADEMQGAGRSPESEAAAARTRFFRRRADTILVSPSRWLALQAENMGSADIRVEVIPNGVPTDVFSPMPKTEAKAVLGLDPSMIWLGLSAASFDRRKGADILTDALEILGRPDLGIVLWGNSNGMDIPDSVRTFSAGYVGEENRQALLYSACDLFVCPSRIDNLPNTVLESMACGTPVIAGHVGGIPEMVHPGQTGWLYTHGTAEACAGAVEKACQAREDWPLYGRRCRDAVEAGFSLNRPAARYKQLYLEMTGPDPRPSITRP